MEAMINIQHRSMVAARGMMQMVLDAKKTQLIVQAMERWLVIIVMQRSGEACFLTLCRYLKHTVYFNLSSAWAHWLSCISKHRRIVSRSFACIGQVRLANLNAAWSTWMNFVVVTNDRYELTWSDATEAAMVASLGKQLRNGLQYKVKELIANSAAPTAAFR